MEVKKEDLLNYDFSIEEKLNKLKALIELPDTNPFTIIKVDGTIKYVNKAFEFTTSLKEMDHIGELNSEPSLSLIINSLSSSIYRSSHFDIHISLPTKNQLKTYRVEINRIVIDKTEYYALSLISYDEQQRFENMMNKLHNALDYGRVAVITTDESGSVNYASRSFEQVLKKEIQELYGKKISTLFSDFLSQNEINKMNLALSNKKQWVKLISDVSEDTEIKFLELVLKPIEYEREMHGFIITAHDITNYVLKNRIIKKSEQRQKSIIDNVSDPLLIVKENKNLLNFENANEKFYDSFNVDKNIVHNSELESVLNPDLYKIIRNAVEQIGNKSQEFIKFKYSDKINKKEYSGKLNYTDDFYEKVRLFIISLSDVTSQLKHEAELKAAYEKEIQLNKLKSSFLANMSHEVRTPLNAIVGYSDLLEDDIKSHDYDSVDEITGYLKEGVTRLLNLVDNIVEVSLLESGVNEVDKNDVNINALINSIISKLDKDINEKELVIDINRADSDIIYFTDECKMRRIFETLIDNAIKYNKRNGVIIINLEKVSNGINIKISDSGIGISDENIKKIFEPFLQADNNGYKREFEGAGLGLTIAQKLTQVLNGELTIKSKPDIGTSVLISFP